MAKFNININKADSSFIKDLKIFYGPITNNPTTETDVKNLKYSVNIKEEFINEEVNFITINTIVDSNETKNCIVIPNSIEFTSIQDTNNLSEQLIQDYSFIRNIDINIDGELVTYSVFVLELDRGYLDNSNHLLTLEKA